MYKLAFVCNVPDFLLGVAIPWLGLLCCWPCEGKHYTDSVIMFSTQDFLKGYGYSHGDVEIFQH